MTLFRTHRTIEDLSFQYFLDKMGIKDYHDVTIDAYKAQCKALNKQDYTQQRYLDPTTVMGVLY